MIDGVDIFISSVCREARSMGFGIENTRNNGRQIDFGHKKLHEGHLRKLYPDVLNSHCKVSKLIDIIAPGRPCTHRPMREIIDAIKRKGV